MTNYKIIKRLITFVFILGIIFATVFTIYSILKNNQSDPCSDIYHTENYAEIYKDTLDSMFDDYTISEPVQTYEPFEKCCDTQSHKRYYTVWTILYKDGNNKEQKFVMQNKWDFSYCIENHIEKTIKNAYDDIHTKAIENIPVSSRLSDISGVLSYRRCDPDEMYTANRSYIENLKSPDSCIKFYKLTEKNIFENIPAYINVNIRFADSEESLKYAEECEKRIIYEMNRITDNTINLAFYSNYIDTFYINGKQVQPESDNYEYELYKYYKDQIY